MMAMGVLIVDADAAAPTVGDSSLVHGDPLAGRCRGRSGCGHRVIRPAAGGADRFSTTPAGRAADRIPRVPFLSLVEADFPNSNFIGVAEAPFTYESLTRHLHFCQAFVSLHPRQQTHDKGQALLRLLVGKGKGIQEVRRLISQVAETDANVLILGESGTGKEVVARAIHELSG